MPVFRDNNATQFSLRKERKGKEKEINKNRKKTTEIKKEAEKETKTKNDGTERR
jgi:hypothetical protein